MSRNIVQTIEESFLSWLSGIGLAREQIALAGALVVMLFFGLLIRHTDLCIKGMQLILRYLGVNAVMRAIFGSGTGFVNLGGILLRDNDRVRHCHIVGSTGLGKTEAIKTLIFEDIRRGRGCFIIDAKGDRELFEEVRGYSKSIGREKDLYLLSATYPRESSIWNPCGLGNPSELQSKFLNANIYSEPYYAKACEFGLIQAFNALVKAKPSGFGLQDLVRELKYLADKQRNESLEGLFFDFGSLVESEWGEILAYGTPKAGKREIKLLDIVQKSKILFVDLPTEGRSIQSSRVGRLLTQELILISGLRKGFPSLNKSGVFSVFIDEFDAFATESFVTFLNKGRSSKFMIHIAHQTISDLKKVSHEFAGQVLGICNIHLVFRQDDPDDAELWARFFGTKMSTKQTHQTQHGTKTGQGTSRETMEFIIGPDRIKTLGVGDCIISVKTRKLIRRVHLPLPKSFRHLGKARGLVLAKDGSPPGRVRGFVARAGEKTAAEELRDLSAKNFGIQTKKPDSSKDGESTSVNKWKMFNNTTSGESIWQNPSSKN